MSNQSNDSWLHSLIQNFLASPECPRIWPIAHTLLSSNKDRLYLNLFQGPRYGWYCTFTVAYGLPLELFQSEDGRRYINLTFGLPEHGIMVNDFTTMVSVASNHLKDHVEKCHAIWYEFDIVPCQIDLGCLVWSVRWLVVHHLLTRTLHFFYGMVWDAHHLIPHIPMNSLRMRNRFIPLKFMGWPRDRSFHSRWSYYSSRTKHPISVFTYECLYFCEVTKVGRRRRDGEEGGNIKHVFLSHDVYLTITN